MKWRDYIQQPTSRLLQTQPAASPDEWLRSVEQRGLIRVGGNVEQVAREPGDLAPEMALGEFFRPDSDVSLDVLQVAGLLLREGRLDRQACERAARRHGGRLYFNWFLSQLDRSIPDPLPDQRFPLHRSRWAKTKAGRTQRDAQQ